MWTIDVYFSHKDYVQNDSDRFNNIDFGVPSSFIKLLFSTSYGVPSSSQLLNDDGVEGFDGFEGSEWDERNAGDDSSEGDGGNDEESIGFVDEEDYYNPSNFSVIDDGAKLGDIEVRDKIDDGAESDYAPSDDLLNLYSSSYSTRFPSFIPDKDGKKPVFKLGMLFASADDFRNAVKEYLIINKKEIKITPNDEWIIRAKCKKPFKWVVFASKYDDTGTL